MNVKSVGGQGGRGQDGQPGGVGIDYAGAPPPPTVYSAAANKCPVVDGYPGGQGGQGGTAGAPGKAGDGGNLEVWVGNGPAHITAILDGGASAERAGPGSPGAGGQGGKGSTCTASFYSPYGMLNIPVVGKTGPRPTGPDAKPQTVDPKPGQPGTVNRRAIAEDAPSFVLTTDALGKQCTPGQLWEVMKAAEDAYLGSRFIDASARLQWIATVAPFVPSLEAHL